MEFLKPAQLPSGKLLITVFITKSPLCGYGLEDAIQAGKMFGVLK